VTPGCPRGSLGVLGEGLGGTRNRRGCLGGSREGPGGALGWFWCYGMVLGSVLGSQHVVISLILVMFEPCEVFLCFFVDFESGFVLRRKEKRYVFE
jgi:hypothetical protein